MIIRKQNKICAFISFLVNRIFLLIFFISRIFTADFNRIIIKKVNFGRYIVFYLIICWKILRFWVEISLLSTIIKFQWGIFYRLEPFRWLMRASWWKLMNKFMIWVIFIPWYFLISDIRRDLHDAFVQLFKLWFFLNYKIESIFIFALNTIKVFWKRWRIIR